MDGGCLSCYFAKLVVSSLRIVVLSDLGSISGEGKNIDVPVFCHEVNMVLLAPSSNVYSVIIIYEMLVEPPVVCTKRSL